MSRKRHLLVVVLLLLTAVLASSSACTIVNITKSSHSSKASEEPIDPDWQPKYVEQAVKAPMDTDNMVAQLAPTVVSIISKRVTYDRFFRAVPETGAGTGVIIDPLGYIVTNAHVVKDADTLTVVLSDGSTFDAVVWVMDKQTDLAVVQIDTGKELPYAHFLSDSLKKLKVLEKVYAVGNALALPGGPTWTDGTISCAQGRAITESTGVDLYDIIQTSAAINPGNSGGPLLNEAGQVVGINTAIASNAENIGFAISTDTAIPVVNSLIRNGSVSWAWLGVKMLTVSPAIQSEYGLAIDYGALVVEVVSGSPAAKAGLKPDDIIIKFGDVETKDSDQLSTAIRSHVSGDKVTITYLRGTDTATVDVTLAQRPS